MQNEIFDKFRKRLVLEGILKAFLFGLAVGGAVDFVVAFITWFTPFNGLWLSLGLGLGTGVIAGVIVYFVKYRPSTKDVARRLDRMGMEERMITMVELDGDESYIAKVQRENAVGVASAVTGKGLKIGASVVSIVLAAVLGVAAGPAMTTVTALAAYGVIDSGGTVIDNITEKDVFYAVEYRLDDDEHGEIIGDAIQAVKAGESTETVVAEAADGFVFDHWEDEAGNKLGDNPARFDTNINDNIVFYAVFAETEERDGDGGDEGDGEGQEGPQKPGDPSDSNNGGGAGSLPDDGSANIIDGETNYLLVYDDYYQQAMQYLADNDETLPEYLRKIIESYFGVLA